MSKHTFVHQEIELEALKSLLGSKWRSPRLGYARESETRGGWWKAGQHTIARPDRRQDKHCKSSNFKWVWTGHGEDDSWLRLCKTVKFDARPTLTQQLGLTMEGGPVAWNILRNHPGKGEKHLPCLTYIICICIYIWIIRYIYNDYRVCLHGFHWLHHVQFMAWRRPHRLSFLKISLIENFTNIIFII